MAARRGRKRARPGKTPTRRRARAQRGATPLVLSTRAGEPEPIEMKDTKVEEALASGEHSGLLEDYFGPAQYAELRRMMQDVQTRSVRGGERVLILPGIMGSKLGHVRSGLFDDVIWVDPVDIIRGRLVELKLNGGRSTIDALGVILFAYLKLKLTLRLAGYDADFFPYDWRLDLIGLGKKLATQIEAAPGKVHLVAHSMGGLVARAALLEKPRKLGRVVMLGTPNFGAFAPIQAFRGTHAVANKVAFLDIHHSKEDLANIFRTFPGLCQMIPSPQKFPADFFQLKSWPTSGVRPSQAFLANALKVQSQLPTDFKDLVIIAGVDRETAVDARVENDEFVYTTSLVGDGTVPLQCVLLPSAKQTYYVAEEHGSLPNNGDVGRAVDSILATGKTELLPTEYQPRRAGPMREVREREMEATIYRGNRGRPLSVGEKRRLLEEVAAPDRSISLEGPIELAPAASIAPTMAEAQTTVADSIVIGRRRQHRLQVTLVFGSITDVEADAYVLGMFKLVPPGGAAQVIDGMIDGAIEQMLARRMFNANVGEISILPTGRHPVRADFIAFAGLGAFDAFSPDVLEVIGENLVRTFVSTRIDEFATVPIGGATGAFTPQALERLLTGFLRGLQDADRDHRFRGITICETDRQRFIGLRREFYRLCGTKLFDGVEVTLREVELPAAPAISTRGPVAPARAESLFLIVREEPKSAPGAITYGVSVLTAGGKATISKGRQEIKKAVLDKLLAELGDASGMNAAELQAFGEKLAELVLPPNITTILQRHVGLNPWVVVHDAASSRIPWETLNIGKKSPALQVGLSHRYEAEDLSIAKYLEQRQHGPTLDILLVVNPTKDLAGAQAEGERIRNLFEKQPSIKIRQLIGDQARKHEIVKCLASGEFDVIHYAGHAFFEPASPEQSGILCAGREVLSGAELVNLGSLPSLVFFNACEAGRLRKGTKTAELNPKKHTVDRVQRGVSFAEAFLRGGVANYLGTYWPVGDSAALKFAETFYQELLAGRAVGDALMQGRKGVGQIGSMDWADYIFYGDPAFVLKKRKGDTSP